MRYNVDDDATTYMDCTIAGATVVKGTRHFHSNVPLELAKPEAA